MDDCIVAHAQNVTFSRSVELLQRVRRSTDKAEGPPVTRIQREGKDNGKVRCQGFASDEVPGTEAGAAQSVLEESRGSIGSGGIRQRGTHECEIGGGTANGPPMPSPLLVLKRPRDLIRTFCWVVVGILDLHFVSAGGNSYNGEDDESEATPFIPGHMGFAI